MIKIVLLLISVSVFLLACNPTESKPKKITEIDQQQLDSIVEAELTQQDTLIN